METSRVTFPAEGTSRRGVANGPRVRSSLRAGGSHASRCVSRYAVIRVARDGSRPQPYRLRAARGCRVSVLSGVTPHSRARRYLKADPARLVFAEDDPAARDAQDRAITAAAER